MNLGNRFGALCLVLALGAVLGESKLFAQGDVIFACVNTATGAVRIVFGGSLCKPNESPLQWNVAGQPGPPGPPGPQGEPGEENVVALATSVLNMTKSVTVPTLGVVEVRCDASGVPNVALRLASGSFTRSDETTMNGATQTTVSSTGGPTTLNFTTTDSSFGRVKQYWITILGVDAQWKVEAFVRPFIAALETPCTAAASVTIMP